MHRAASSCFSRTALCLSIVIASVGCGREDQAPLPPTGSGGFGGAPPASGGTFSVGGAGSGGISPSGGVTGSGGLTSAGGAMAGGGIADAGGVTDGSADPPEEDSGLPPGPPTTYPGRRWSVPAATHGTVIESNVRITMSDGVVLVGDVSYPADLGTTRRASGKFPVILTQNPYGAVFGAASGELFVTHGYIFASVDVRGTNRSGGTQDLFGPEHVKDGAALVTWAANLQGSDGKVGLHGCSQLGINQLETVTALPPNSPVKAMIPACASGDFYRDTAFDNGIPTTVAAFLVADHMPTGGDKVFYREYWKGRDRLARAPAIAKANIPMLLWSGWHEPGAIGSLELYTALQNLDAGRPQTAKLLPGDPVTGKYQVIMGDWQHAGGLDNGIQLQWYDTWIKGTKTGLPKDTKTPLHLAELGGPKRWVNATPYPIVETYTPFYLSGNKKLSRSAGAAGEDEVSWVPDGWPGGAIEYESEPFANGAMLAGPIAARLEVASTNRNVQLSVDVFDRGPGGTRTKITHGGILGSLRRTSAEASWTDKNGLPMRPFLTLDQDEPLTAGQATRLDVPLWPKVWAIEPGHTLVVRIATQPQAADCGGVLSLPVGCNLTNPQRSSLNGGVYTLHHGGQSASLLSLPLLDRGSLPASGTAVSPTGSASTPLPIDW